MLHECGGLPHAATGTEHIRSGAPVVTFADSLEVGSEVNALPSGVKSDTEVVSRGVVTDDGEIAVIIKGVGSLVDLAVSCDILVHQITGAPARSPGRTVALEPGIHLGLSLGEIVGLVTPDLTDLAAHIVGRKGVGLVRIAGDFLHRVRDDGTDTIGEVLADLVTP